MATTREPGFATHGFTQVDFDHVTRVSIEPGMLIVAQRLGQLLAHLLLPDRAVSYARDAYNDGIAALCDSPRLLCVVANRAHMS